MTIQRPSDEDWTPEDGPWPWVEPDNGDGEDDDLEDQEDE